MRIDPLQLPAVLVVNAGSSSLKFGLYGMPCDAQLPAARVGGVFEGLEPGGTPTVRVGRSAAVPLSAPAAPCSPFDHALRELGRVLADAAGEFQLAAVAHRIVHGGDRHADSVVLDDAADAYLQSLAPLAPLHQPANLAAVRACLAAWPALPQIGCFDTAFHATLPEVERRFALPDSLAARGIRRYGFHGLSYRYVAHALAQRSARAHGRVLVAHLGNGASLCGLEHGRSVATSMGFSALDGLMMGTRSGSVDAGVLLHLLRDGWSAEQLEQLLYRQSGLRGVSGISADMRTLRASDTPAAKFAIELFTHRLLREAGALVAALGGIDALVFTGGIGEHDAVLRAQVCAALGYLGIALDAGANARAGADAAPLHAPYSPVEVWMIPTDEGAVAAADAWRLLATDRCTQGAVHELAH